MTRRDYFHSYILLLADNNWFYEDIWGGACVFLCSLATFENSFTSQITGFAIFSQLTQFSCNSFWLNICEASKFKLSCPPTTFQKKNILAASLYFQSGHFALSVRSVIRVRHFPIELTAEKKYFIGRYNFDSLEEVISYYSENPLFELEDGTKVKLGASLECFWWAVA